MRWFALLPLLWLAACSSLPDSRPSAVREAEQQLFQGVDSFEENDFHRAGEYFARALDAYRSIDDSEGQLIAHLNLLETALVTRRLEFAGRQLEAAQAVHRRGETGPHYQGRIELLRARLAYLRGENGAVIEQLEKLLPSFDENHKPKARVNAVHLGAVTLRTQLAFDGDELTPMWLARMQACTDRGEPLQNARLLRFEARLAEPAEGEKKLRAALAVYRELAHRPELSETLRELAELMKSQGRDEEARALSERADLVEAHFRLPVQPK